MQLVASQRIPGRWPRGRRPPGEAQDLLPYTSRGEVVALDDATLTMTLPDGLTDQLIGHIKGFRE